VSGELGHCVSLITANFNGFAFTEKTCWVAAPWASVTVAVTVHGAPMAGA